jgi:methyl-accepting chemotaxis protein
VRGAGALQKPVDTRDAQVIESISSSCGEVVVGCADVAGFVQSVIDSSALLRDEHRALAETVAGLEADQHRVLEASDEARLLSSEAIRQLGEGTRQIELSLGWIARVLLMVDLVRELDRQNDDITQSTGTISGRVAQVHDVLENFQKASIEDEAKLVQVHSRVGELEDCASQMFDHIVHADLSPRDSQIVALAQEAAQEAIAIAQAGLADGTLTEAMLFDENYREVAGTNLTLYRNNLSDWADRNWRALLDTIQLRDEAIIANVCDDRNGFMPTHLTERSRKPTGDYRHDLQHCRNGRMITTPFDKWIKQSTKPYSMADYRHEGDGEQYRVVRLVSVPLMLDGKRWGEFEISYVL